MLHEVVVPNESVDEKTDEHDPYGLQYFFLTAIHIDGLETGIPNIIDFKQRVWIRRI